MIVDVRAGRVNAASHMTPRMWRKLGTLLMWGGLVVLGCLLLGAAFSALSSFGGSPDGGGGAAQARAAAADARAALLFRLAIFVGGGITIAGWVLRRSLAHRDEPAI